MFLAGQCAGLQPFSLKHFALFGGAGSFKESQAPGCGSSVNPGIPPSPLNQPTGGMHRSIPTKDCYLRGTTAEQIQHAIARTREFWLTGLVGKSFYFNINNPARYYNPDFATKIGRVVDLCYVPTHPMYETLQCQETRATGSVIEWNDVRSPFRGAIARESHFSGFSLPSYASSTVYTDIYSAGGRNGVRSPN